MKALVEDNSTPAAPPAVATIEAAIDQWVVAQLADLRDEARAVVTGYEAAIQAALRDEDRRSLGQVILRVRVPASPPATPGTFAVDWYRYHYARQGGRLRCFTTYIPRGDGDGYPPSAFRGLLRAWQRPLVLAAEARCALIRRAVRQIAQVRTQYRTAERTRREVQEALAALSAEAAAGS